MEVEEFLTLLRSCWLLVLRILLAANVKISLEDGQQTSQPSTGETFVASRPWEGIKGSLSRHIRAVPSLLAVIIDRLSELNRAPATPPPCPKRRALMRHSAAP